MELSVTLRLGDDVTCEDCGRKIISGLDLVLRIVEDQTGLHYVGHACLPCGEPN
jgi:RNase P subunit RPR2